MSSVMEFISSAQRDFHDLVAFNMQLVRDMPGPQAIGTLCLAGFAYGVLHAIGPGHGKLVVAGYMLADNGTLKRGLCVTALSSVMQATVAVALVMGLFFGLGMARQKTEWVAAWVEASSFLMVAALGLVFFIRGVAALRGIKVHNAAHGGNARAAGHGNQCGCGHAHGPSTDMLASRRSLQDLAAMVVSIGMRPCSGALLLMFLACLMGQVLAGVAATYAMALGTGLATSVVAVMAAHSRRGVLWLAGSSETKLAAISAGLKLVAGAAIMAIGIMLFVASAPRQDVANASGAGHPLMKQRVQ